MNTQLILRPLAPSDAVAVVRLMTNQPPDYVRFFYAFGTDEEAVAKLLGSADRDVYGGVFWGGGLICVYMLRGWDEGHDTPTFGLVVDAEHRGHAVMTVTLEAAKLIARLAGCDRIMAKANPNNAVTSGALRLGFLPDREEPGTGNIIYYLAL